MATLAHPSDPGRVQILPSHRLDLSIDVLSLPLREQSPKHQLQRFIQETSERTNLSLCRRGMRTQGADGTSYRVTCKNSWLCPNCSPVALREFAAQSARHAQNAPQALAVVLTVRHDCSQPLSEVLSDLYRIKTAFTSGRSYVTFRKAYGIVGHSLVTELKHSDQHGWNAHLQGIVFLENGSGNSQDSILPDALRLRWVQTAHQQGVGASLEAQKAFKLSPDARGKWAAYNGKDSARFITNNMGSRTVGDIIYDAQHGDHEAVSLFLEVEAATKNRRRFAVTPQLGWKLSTGGIAPTASTDRLNLTSPASQR